MTNRHTPSPHPERSPLSTRTLSIQSAAFGTVAGQPALVPLKLEGSEGINSLFDYRLTLQTPDACNFQASEGSNFELSSFVGRELTCRIELAGDGHFDAGAHGAHGVREISGLITSARLIGESSRHALYEFTLRPWLHLATLTTDCKVFQDMSPVEVIEAVLADYAFAADKRLIGTYTPCDYTVQYNESDFEFITRLMQEWGINYHFEHSAGVHRLVWSDHNGAFQGVQHSSGNPDNTGHRIPFYPLGHKIDQEYIHGFSPINRLSSGRYASRDYDYTRPRALLDASAAAPGHTGYAGQEVYLWRADKPGMGGSDYSQPWQGADEASSNQTGERGQHFARLRLQALQQGGLRATGTGHVRSIVAGCTFSLSGHPQTKANTEYITLHTRFVIENAAEDSQRNVMTDGQPHSPGFMSAMTAMTDAQRLSGQWRVLVQFDVQPTTQPLRPQASQPKPRTGGPETALVVGPGADTAESNIYTDSLGRIKVQFPWDRYGQKNHHSSCWVRVASAWAGNQLGAMHLPRIGQEVVIDFLGGDPDLPMATGRVYNQLNTPPWSLPAQQALSGFRSRELTPTSGGNSAAGRSNHLILDDTAQQIQAQLKSDHQHSQLSLGHITRIDGNAGRQDARGEGFDLRTDGHGVVRAGAGLLVTTEARPNAQAHAKDMGETSRRLDEAQDQHETLADLARRHQAQDGQDQLEVAQSLKAQNQAIRGEAAQGPFPEFSEPHLTLASPAGIESSTPGSTHQHSGQHHAITSGGHASVSTGKSFLASARQAIRLFAYRAGMKLIAANGNIDIQALQGSINILAKLDITQTASRITLTAREEIVINGGGSYTTWTASGITSGTTGAHTVHAASHGFPDARSLPVPGVNLQRGEPNLSRKDVTSSISL